MTRTQTAAKRISQALAEINTLAKSLGYATVTLAENPNKELGPWYRVVAGGLVLGAANSWLECLTEAREYLN